jgi:hypothetical protein
LATSLASPVLLERAEGYERERDWGFAIGLVTLLTLLSFGINGYHPYAEDGGLYMTGIKHLLDPTMYPHGTEFVTGHLRFSMFAPMIAGLVRESAMSVETVLLLLHLASLWATLFAAWLLAARCFAGRESRIGAVSLLAIWMTLPIAGTSLMLMDPYVTARSISTPCALLALAGALEFLLPQSLLSPQSPPQSKDEFWPSYARERRRGLILCCAAMAMAIAVHPLMAADALGCVLVLGCVLSSTRAARVAKTMGVCLTVIAVAAVMQMISLPESGAYRRVAMTRYYWFLSQWRWYEVIGLIAPLAILAVVALKSRGEEDVARKALSRMAVVVGITAIAVALLFARVGSETYLVARLQPLRAFQLIYVLMILMVGAAVAKWMLRGRPIRWAVALVLLAGVMVYAERQTFPDSAHVELPNSLAWSAPLNKWEQAFVWISRNTPKDALFALDAHYITKPGEDAQSFRAVAERSALPDYSKDGGEASITPKLTDAWMTGQLAQTKLSTESDEERVAVLKPLGVTWVVLDESLATKFNCAYANGTVKVCRLP